jgi:phosphatidylglycerol---prolipoprotein diacylglyceryl transferase
MAVAVELSPQGGLVPIVWNVDPVIVTVGPIELRWYSLLFALAFFASYHLMVFVLKRENREQAADLGQLLIYGVVGTLVGARLGQVFFYEPMYFLAHPLEIIKVWHGGLASHGGFAGVVIAVFLFTRRYKSIGFLDLLDRVTLPAMLSASLIRIGNFFNSEIIGRPTDLPWGIVFQRVDAIPRHPSMLYESLAYLLIFAVLLVLYLRTDIRKISGALVGTTLTLAFSARFLIEFSKEVQEPFERLLPLDMGQILSLPFVFLGLYMVVRGKRMMMAKGSGDRNVARSVSKWDERYSAETYYYGTEPNDFLRGQIPLLKKGGRVLCLAEGEGRNAVFLAQQGFDVTAVDGSSVGLEKLQRFATERKVHVTSIVCDLADFDLGHSRWDGIVAIWCHLPSNLRRKVHSRCVDALAADGIFILESYTPKQLEFKTGGPSSADMLTTLSELKQDLSSLTIVIGQEIERDVREGVGHIGKSAVVEFVARKVT